jgi:beta-1,4-mannosyl-glycoprotein beta-1,4-N-acetylglucosaminyltransferase
MSVYSCSLFLNENDVLEIKLNEQWNFVDKFIIIEAGETHTGNKKSFNFDHNRFEQYKEKLVYVSFDNFSTEMEKYPWLLDDFTKFHYNHLSSPKDWHRDHFQANYIVKVLMDLGAKDDDLVMLTCLDEIISEKGFYSAKEVFNDKSSLFDAVSGWSHQVVYNNIRPYIFFEMYTYAYKMNLLKNKARCGAAIAEFGLFKKILPTTLRQQNVSTHEDVVDGGWHYTYMDDTDGDLVVNKYKSWAHANDILENGKKRSEFSKEEALNWLFKEFNISIPDSIVPIVYPNHPKYLVNNLDRFQQYLLRNN